MTLNERINADLKEAMKSGEKTKLETLRSIRAQMIELSKRGTGKEITPDEELSVLMSAIKKRKEAMEMYEKGGRMELVKQEQQELEIINAYLPKQMSKEEAEQVIMNIVTQTGAASAKDFGKVMPLAMKELKGKIDGKIVQELVKNKLGG
ncbi:MAG: GatB/YqeY domain-containing protein [Ignavibacteriales bacterium]|nr:GatB/YqeY domain-containing protein [Ignavibacteriales bacterium]